MAYLLLLAAFAGPGLAQQLTLAKSWTGWDCCKPVCSNGNFRTELLQSRGMVKVCNANNQVMPQNDGLWATSGCQSGGTAYMCQDLQPVPVSENLSYGFAIQVGGNSQGDNPNCCKCYEVEWLSGDAEDKKMIVQVVTPGQAAGDIKNNDLIILMPGGGQGPSGGACARQYGNSYDWGSQYGGVSTRAACERLPQNLQGGCYWRFNWAGGTMNGWDIIYKPVECPSRLRDISGCAQRP